MTSQLYPLFLSTLPRPAPRSVLIFFVTSPIYVPVSRGMRERTTCFPKSVEEAEDLATGLLPPALFVVQNADRRGEDQVSEQARRQQLDDPVLNLVERNVETGRNDTALVHAAVELDHNLAGTTVVDDLKLANVTCANQSTNGQRSETSHARHRGDCK